MKIRALALAALLVATTAHAEDTSTPSPAPDLAGANAPLEADFQLGTFIGGRLKGTVYTGHSFTMDLEGLYGSDLAVFQPFSDGSSTAWGGGVRFNHYLSNSGHSAWLLSPAVDFYDADSHGTTFVAPNVDLSWVHEFSPQLGFVFGFQGGVQIGMSGHSDSGDSYSGKSIADIGTYVGLRF